MECPQCGAELTPDDAICPSCGAEVGAATQAVPEPPAPDEPAAPLPPQAAEQPAEPEPPQAGEPEPAAAAQAEEPVESPSAEPPYDYEATPAEQERGAKTSIGVVLGVIVGVLLLIGFVGAGVYYGYQMLSTAAQAPTVRSLESSATSAAASESVPASATASTAATATAPPPTEAEARAVIKKFMDLRLKKDVAGSKVLCTQNMLTGDDSAVVNNKSWRPNSYKITLATPDKQYINVTVMASWPESKEPLIFSVLRDPASGKALIDNMIDPATSPELVAP